MVKNSPKMAVSQNERSENLALHFLNDSKAFWACAMNLFYTSYWTIEGGVPKTVGSGILIIMSKRY